jgi:hypothetical protein
MTRILLVLAAAAAGCPAPSDESDPEPDPIVTQTPGTTTPSAAYHLRWELDGQAAVERDLYGVDALSLVTAAGDGCAPTVVVFASPGRISAEYLHVQLHFAEPPAPGVEAPLAAAVPRDLSDPYAPDFVPLTVADQRVFGGTVRVEALDDSQWVFRFEGPSDCPEDGSACTPIPDGTLTVEPLGSNGMPALASVCLAGEVFPWPDGWDGCAAIDPAEAGTCPSPMPW